MLDDRPTHPPLVTGLRAFDDRLFANLLAKGRYLNVPYPEEMEKT